MYRDQRTSQCTGIYSSALGDLLPKVLSLEVGFVRVLFCHVFILWVRCRSKLRTDAKVRDVYRIGHTLGTGGAHHVPTLHIIVQDMSILKECHTCRTEQADSTNFN
jgi:hypothetical protein